MGVFREPAITVPNIRLFEEFICTLDLCLPAFPLCDRGVIVSRLLQKYHCTRPNVPESTLMAILLCHTGILQEACVVCLRIFWAAGSSGSLPHLRDHISPPGIFPRGFRGLDLSVALGMAGSGFPFTILCRILAVRNAQCRYRQSKSCSN